MGDFFQIFVAFLENLNFSSSTLGFASSCSKYLVQDSETQRSFYLDPLEICEHSLPLSKPTCSQAASNWHSVGIWDSAIRACKTLEKQKVEQCKAIETGIILN